MAILVDDLPAVPLPALSGLGPADVLLRTDGAGGLPLPDLGIGEAGGAQPVSGLALPVLSVAEGLEGLVPVVAAGEGGRGGVGGSEAAEKCVSMVEDLVVDVNVPRPRDRTLGGGDDDGGGGKAGPMMAARGSESESESEDGGEGEGARFGLGEQAEDGP
ncbi:hypothetical protein GP486_001084 [Trichoglossum hirsutum]|uniref:Uncharacterized protein n=1 Tax=Trichoglossum hirsutum TaxID=265104 RepID=A0A9P8LGL4_9PEZI|nr:hypothetical protein GP486_001084 [Trichoglossum hirsutum]